VASLQLEGEIVQGTLGKIRIRVPRGLLGGPLRRKAHRGSAVDAIVVALAESGGTVLTSDADDLGALARHADDVTVERA
jgi:hypothetical protein